jgi:hypothetical protein
MMGNRA